MEFIYFSPNIEVLLIQLNHPIYLHLKNTLMYCVPFELFIKLTLFGLTFTFIIPAEMLLN